MSLKSRISALPPWTIVVTCVVGLVVLPFVIRTFGVEAFKIPAASMSPTLLVGDHIFVRKLAYGMVERRVPDRGDVIVFQSPEHPEQDFVKRVVGLPGDEIVVRAGAVYINGWKVPSCVAGRASVGGSAFPHTGELVVEFIDEKAYLVFHDASIPPDPDAPQGPYKVAPGQVFVLGDNRENSFDSRLWFAGRGGGVPIDNVKGRASIVWMSFAPQGILWSRIGTKLGEPPSCPEGFPSATCEGLARCLANRPERSATTPASAH